MNVKRTVLDYGLTFFSEFLVLLAGLWVYKLAGERLGDSGFSEYAVSRRTISFIQPLLLLGIGVAMPRYIAFSRSGDARFTLGQYFTAAGILFFFTTVSLLVITLIFQQALSSLAFGAPEYAELIFPLGLCVSGLMIHSWIYAFFRGNIRMVHANLLQVINLGIVPVCAFITGENCREVLMLTAYGWLMVASFFVLFAFPSLEWRKGELWSVMKELLYYGIQRVPGDLMIMGLLALPAYLAAHWFQDDLMTAGYIAFAMSMLSMAGAAFGPVCLILLPQASNIIAKRDIQSLRKVFNNITLLTLALTIAGVLILLPFLKDVLELYLGAASEALLNAARLALIAVPGYCLYISLRSIIDAFYVRAINSRNILIAFALFVITVVIFRDQTLGISFVLWAMAISMIFLGIITYLQIYFLLKKGIAP